MCIWCSYSFIYPIGVAGCIVLGLSIHLGVHTYVAECVHLSMSGQIFSGCLAIDF